MKLQLHFKTPDVLKYATDGFVLFEDEYEFEKLKKKLEGRIRFDEYVTLIYDTETDVLSVLGQK